MDFNLKKETVEFRDNDGKVLGTVVVTQATLLDEEALGEMEMEASQKNARELSAWMEKHSSESIPASMIRKHNYSATIYPKLAACSTGDVPSEEEALRMPVSELNRWYLAAKNVNPDWFRIFEEIAEEMRKNGESEEKIARKKRRKRAG